MTTSSRVVISGRYELEKEVGRGGCGVVFRAIDRTNGTPVAVKMLLASAQDPSFMERMVREQQAMQALAGTHAVSVLDLCRAPSGAPCLVMEWLEGSDLEKRLTELEERQTRFELQELISVLEPVVDTLQKAHELGIVHRDVKPANIFLVEEPRGVRLLDFGFARIRTSTTLTATGMVMGSPSYIAPEAWKGNSKLIDHRADVYSLGVIMFRALAGSVPFETSSLIEKLKLVTTASRPSLCALRPDLPCGIDGWVERALAIQPEDRFQSVAALFTGLLELLYEGGLLLRPAEGSLGQGETARNKVRKLEGVWRAAASALRRLVPLQPWAPSAPGETAVPVAASSAQGEASAPVVSPAVGETGVPVAVSPAVAETPVQAAVSSAGEVTAVPSADPLTASSAGEVMAVAAASSAAEETPVPAAASSAEGETAVPAAVVEETSFSNDGASRSPAVQGSALSAGALPDRLAAAKAVALGAINRDLGRAPNAQRASVPQSVGGGTPEGWRRKEGRSPQTIAAFGERLASVLSAVEAHENSSSPAKAANGIPAAPAKPKPIPEAAAEPSPERPRIRPAPPPGPKPVWAPSRDELLASANENVSTSTKEKETQRKSAKGESKRRRPSKKTAATSKARTSKKRKQKAQAAASQPAGRRAKPGK